MDIKLIGGDVFILLNKLRKSSIPIPKIVLVTSFPEFAIKSLNEYRNCVVKYIMQPFLEDWESKFRDAIDTLMITNIDTSTIQNSISKDNESILVKSESKLYNINFNNLNWVEVDGGGSIYLVLKDHHIKVDMTLAKFLKKTPDNLMIQIRRDYAVN